MKRLSWEKKNEYVYKPLGITLFPTQQRLCSNTEATILMFAGGIGCGKSMIAALNVLPECLLPGRRYWLIGTGYEQTRSEFNWLLRFLRELKPPIEFVGPPSMPLEGDWSIKLENGTVVETKSARNDESLHSFAIDGFVGCEAGQLSEYTVINRMLPRISRAKDGRGWIYLGGTFEGGNTWFAQTFMKTLAGNDPEWAAYAMATWENTVDFPGGLDNPQLQFMQRTMSEDEFMQRYGAVPMNPQGVVMKEFMTAHHITPQAEYRPEWPVQVWVDPGVGVYSVLAVQIDPEDSVVNIIDEIYLKGGSSEQAIGLAVQREWWKGVQSGWIDIAMAEQRMIWESGAIWRDLSQKMGTKLTGVRMSAQKVPVNAGIERVRQLLHCKIFPAGTKRPIWKHGGQDGISRILINPRCVSTINEFSLYQYPKQGTIDGNPIDKYNHSMKAMSYGCVGNFGFINVQVFSRGSSPLHRAVYGQLRG